MFLPLNTFENICVCFLLLMIYSTIGWVAEMIYHSIVIGHMSEKRGFLNGFLCPIYGHGALLVLYVLHGGLKNPILTFLAGMVLTSALEYFTSWIMEALFHMRWWDYSNCKYQLNGRVCLTNTFFFGLGSVLLCHVVNPPIMAWLFRVGPAYTIPAASFISGLYLMDITLSVRSAIQLSTRLDKLRQLRQEVKDHLHFVPVETISQVLETALVKPAAQPPEEVEELPSAPPRKKAGPARPRDTHIQQ